MRLVGFFLLGETASLALSPYGTQFKVPGKASQGFCVQNMSDDARRRSIQMMIQRVLDDAPFSMRQIAEDAGVSYDAVRSWATNRRTPKAENLVQLANALRRRAEQLNGLAAELQAVGSEERN